MTARKPSKLAGVRRVPIATVVETDHVVLFPAGHTKVHSITSIARPANGRVRIEFGVGEHAQHFDAPGGLAHRHHQEVPRVIHSPVENR
ncbi:hypothetical protein [Saccharopolyspora shandongensis]|uniref:hypothetical protein n=1 Tax=Saccharopolyspora shandongensis TaxID=418495 RepID=UPI0033DD6F7A